MKGRRVSINNDLKRKLTVSPWLPGAPVPVNYTMYKITNKFMYIPKYYNNDGTLIENENNPCDIKISSEPRDYQINVIKEIHNELVKSDSCIACLYTGWGKTFASLYISNLLGVKTLIIVHKETLLEQWREQIIKFLGIEPGIIQGKKIDTSPNVCIGMIQSISMKEYTSETFNCFSFTIFDETHHYSSNVFSNVFYKIGSKYNLGLTATIKRADRLEYTLNWFLGKIAVNVKLLLIEPEIHLRSFNDYPEDTVKYLPNGKVNSVGTVSNINKIHKRNLYIIDLIKECYDSNRKILILTNSREHCEFFYSNLKQTHSIGIYYGGMKQEELKKSNNCRIIVGTYQMASEGYDNPTLDTLILASPKCSIEQAVGRILRKKNENPPLVIDINDTISVFNNWNRKRQSFYKTNKFKVVDHTKKTIDISDIDISKDFQECLL